MAPRNSKSGGNTGHRGAITAFALLLVIAIVLPLSGIAVLTMRDSNNKLNSARPLWVAAQPAEEETRQAVDIVLEWRPAPALLAPDWTGTVTAVEEIPPEGLRSGNTVASIDGVSRIAANTSVPFYRTLSAGDRGTDVSALNDLLQRLGFAAGEGDRFVWATLVGVRSLALSIGVLGSSQVTAFEPSWIVYLPSEGMTGEEISLDVGAPAPVAGTALIAPTLRLTSGTLTAAGAVVSDSSSDSTEIDVTTPVDAIVPDSTKFLLSDGEVVSAAGHELALSDPSTVAPEALALLSDGLQLGARSARALVMSPPQAGAILVPSSAIYTTADGATCVTRRGAAGVGGVPVVVISNTAGKSVVTGDLKLTDEVLVGAPAEERTCD